MLYPVPLAMSRIWTCKANLQTNTTIMSPKSVISHQWPRHSTWLLNEADIFMQILHWNLNLNKIYKSAKEMATFICTTGERTNDYITKANYNITTLTFQNIENKSRANKQRCNSWIRVWIHMIYTLYSSCYSVYWIDLIRLFALKKTF